MSPGERRGVSREDIDEFEMVAGQLERAYAELASLGKGKGADALNEFKLRLLNALLLRANALLGDRYVAVPGFEQFDVEMLPSTSDALLVVSQYLGALEKLRGDNVRLDRGRWVWVIDGEASGITTTQPDKLAKKK